MPTPIRFALLSLLLFVPFAAPAHEPAAKAPADAAMVDPAARPAIALIEEFSSALRTGALDRVGELLADDVLILESGGAERSREEYLASHAGHDAAFLKDAKVSIAHRTARVAGDLAWVGTESEITTTSKGKPVRLASSETMVLRRGPEGWRIEHIHWSSRPLK